MIVSAIFRLLLYDLVIYCLHNIYFLAKVQTLVLLSITLLEFIFCITKLK